MQSIDEEVKEAEKAPQKVEEKKASDSIEAVFDPNESRIPNDPFQDGKYGEQNEENDFVDPAEGHEYSLGGIFIGKKIMQKANAVIQSSGSYSQEDDYSDNESPSVSYDPLSAEAEDEDIPGSTSYLSHLITHESEKQELEFPELEIKEEEKTEAAETEAPKKQEEPKKAPEKKESKEESKEPKKKLEEKLAA